MRKAILLFVLALGVVNGQPPSPNTLAQTLDKFKADYAIPEAPAFTLLGVTPETVTRPASPSDLGTAIINGLDNAGNLKSGVAIDVNPLMLLIGDHIKLSQYRDHPFLRILLQSKASIATVKGTTEDDKSVKLGVGLHVTLFDAGDARMDETFITCANNALTSTIAAPADPTLPVEAQETAKSEDLISRLKPCRKDLRARRWNASRWIVAGAFSEVSPDGKRSNLEWDGSGFWTSISYGFEQIPSLQKRSDLIFHVRHRRNEMVPDPLDSKVNIRQNMTIVGGRWRFGSEQMNFSLEGAFLKRDPRGAATERYSRISAGIERRITNNFWFNVTIGADRGRELTNNQSFVRTSVNWSFNSEPKMNLGNN